MPFHWVCRKGHGQGVWGDHEQTMAREAGKDPFVRDCHCGLKRKLERFSLNMGVQVIGDVPEHFNVTLGEGVRSRRHLKDLQKEHGCQDFEPSSRTRELIAESQARTASARRHGSV